MTGMPVVFRTTVVTSVPFLGGNWRVLKRGCCSFILLAAAVLGSEALTSAYAATRESRSGNIQSRVDVAMAMGICTADIQVVVGLMPMMRLVTGLNKQERPWNEKQKSVEDG